MIDHRSFRTLVDLSAYDRPVVLASRLEAEVLLYLDQCADISDLRVKAVRYPMWVPDASFRTPDGKLHVVEVKPELAMFEYSRQHRQADTLLTTPWYVVTRSGTVAPRGSRDLSWGLPSWTAFQRTLRSRGCVRPGSRPIWGLAPADDWRDRLGSAQPRFFSPTEPRVLT